MSTSFFLESLTITRPAAPSCGDTLEIGVCVGGHWEDGALVLDPFCHATDFVHCDDGRLLVRAGQKIRTIPADIPHAEAALEQREQAYQELRQQVEQGHLAGEAIFSQEPECAFEFDQRSHRLAA